MNNKEFWSNKANLKCYEYKFVQSKLNEWKLENNIMECCVIHHRDDTEEVIAYNDAHYERWGFNEDGDFIEGQYVQFMTKSAHSSHHHKGKRISEETKAKMSNALKGENNPQYGLKGEKSPNYGKHHSEETKEKISNSLKGKKSKPLSNECKVKISAMCKRRLIGLRLLYNIYKSNNGAKKWNDFQKAIYNGDITFEERPISVFL